VPFYLSISSLPTFADCQGRWAINNVREIKSKYRAKSTQKNVGSVFGTIAHKALSNMLELKRDYGIIQDWRIEYALAAEEFSKQVSAGVRFDATTGKLEAGLLQLERVLRESWFSIVQHARPEFIEMPVGFAVAGDEWLNVVGHPDGCMIGGGIKDWKFSSKKDGNYMAQGGGYLLGYRSTHGKEPKDFELNLIQRVGETLLQPDLLCIPYDKTACIEIATKQIKLAAGALKQYDSERTEHKKNWSFNFNGNSKYCNKKSCGAHGTEFCNQWIA